MNFTYVKITTTIPPEHAKVLREALGNAGAGVIGEYSFCSFSVAGKGRFKAGENTSPHVGRPGEFEVVDEERIEVTCERGKARTVITALKQAHPYEEPIIQITPLLTEEDV